MKMLYGAVCPIIVAIISIILAGQAGAVEISASMDPPILEIGKAATLTWNIKFSADERTKSSRLYLKKRKNDSFIEIASYSDKTLPLGRTLLGEKAAVTSITPYEVIVNFEKLFYFDEFYFMCQAMGVTTSLLGRHINSNLSVVDVKGGPTICGNSIIKEEYVLPVGVSSLNVTLCGNPRPRLSYIFDGNKFEALGIVVDKTTRMYKYKIQMKNIEKSNCGQNITFEVDGFGDKLEKSSTIIVKYKPRMVKRFKYTKTIGENCTVFKVDDKHNPKCPLTYEVKIYDKNKIAAVLPNNPFTFASYSKSLKVCRIDWFNKGEFATITPIWRHEPSGQELVGPVSDFIEAQTTKFYNNDPGGGKKTSTLLTYVIPLVLGIVLIFMIMVILLIYKHKRTEQQKEERQNMLEEIEEKPFNEQQKEERQNMLEEIEEKPFNDSILEEVLEYIIKELSEEVLKKFVQFFNPDFELRSRHRHQKRCDYLRQQKLRWTEVKYDLLEMGRKDLVQSIVKTTNITKGLQKMVELSKEILQDKYLQTSLLKPILDPEELFVDLSIIRDSDVDEKALISDRQYHLKCLEAEKDFISYKDIASMEERCILIQGVAGAGKSTLVRKLISEWYEGRLFNGENGNTQTHLLLPILCRELNMLKVEPNEEFDNILAKVFPEITCLTTLRQNDVNVLIVIDGIDELRGITTIREEECDDLPTVNFVKKLLDPRFMKQTRCMVVGRPRIINFLEKFNRGMNQRRPKRIQICGFNEENVKNYVYKTFEKSNEFATEVHEKITSSKLTKYLSTIPLYLEVIVSIFKDNPFATTPKTSTELLLYNFLIFLRNQKSGERLSLGMFIKMYSTEIINFVKEISKLSYQSLIKNEISFEVDTETDVLEELVNAGLMLKSCRGESATITYQFLHLTFQELFAAFHIILGESVIDLRSPVLRETLIHAAVIQGISCGNYGDSKDYVLFSLLQLPELKENFQRIVP